MENNAEFNAVLLPQLLPTPMVVVREADGTAFEAFRDGAFIGVLIEELVALSVMRVAVVENDSAAIYGDALPAAVRDRLVVVDERRWRNAVQLREALFAPLLREAGVSNPNATHLDVSSLVTVRSTRLAENDVKVALDLYSEASRFFLAMDQQLSVQADVQFLLRGARILRPSCKDPESRMCLASLEGLLGTYQTIDQPLLKASPRASSQMIELFLRLLEDADYRQLSRAAGALGTGKRVRRVLQLMRRSIQRILVKPLFKQAFELGAKAVTIATQIPLPTSGIADALKTTKFLPPIVNFGDVLEQALVRWKEQNSPETAIRPKCF
jgi:hypothetical protein